MSLPVTPRRAKAGAANGGAIGMNCDAISAHRQPGSIQRRRSAQAGERSRELAESIRKMALNWTLRLRQREAILLR